MNQLGISWYKNEREAGSESIAQKWRKQYKTTPLLYKSDVNSA